MQRTTLLGTVKNPFTLTALVIAGLYFFLRAGNPAPGNPKVTGEWMGNPLKPVILKHGPAEPAPKFQGNS